MEADVLPLFSSISASFASFRGGRLLCNVVVLSPDEDLRSAICWVLELLGSKPHPCPCVEDALSLLAIEPPDLVLCNLEVANDLLTTLRSGEVTNDHTSVGSTASLTPAVVLLCEKRMDKRMLNACLNAGARSYITKPLRIQAIRGVIVGHGGGAVPEARIEADEESTPHDRRYEKIKELGRGRYGEVSLVQRRRDGARFALKEVMIDTLSAAEQRRVLEELRLHRAFDCPCVVRYFSSWMQGDIAYLLLEYVENGSLSKLVGKCREGGTEISDNTILDWAGQILIGLLYLHRKEVVHRDLKLDNVLGPDNLGRVKLADFGISKRLNGQEMLTSKIGTPEIMAPERCVDTSKGEEAAGYGPESDLWSLGVVLYELATLRPPFSMEESASIGADHGGGDCVLSYDQRLKRLFSRIRTEEPPPLPFSRSGALHKIIPGLLRKRPQDRPSASDLCRDAALGSAVHAFLKKHKLLEHPSILEIIDVLPSGRIHGGSRIESSDIDVCTLQRFGSMTGTLKSTLAASFGGANSFLDRSRLSHEELKKLPGVTDIAEAIAEVNSVNSTSLVSTNKNDLAVSESPTCIANLDEPFADRPKLVLPLGALKAHPEVSTESPRSPRVSSRAEIDGDVEGNDLHGSLEPPLGSSAPSRPPRVPLPIPLGPMMRSKEASTGKRLREKPGPVGNFYTHPQRSPTMLRNGDVHALDCDRLAVSPCKVSSSRRGPEDVPRDITAQSDMGDSRRPSKRGATRCLEPLDAKLAAKVDASLQQVDLRSGFQTPPRQTDPWNDLDWTGRSTGRSTGVTFGSGEGTGRSSGRSSSQATCRSGGRSMGQRSVSALLLPSLPNGETSPPSHVEQPHPVMTRPASATSLMEVEGLRGDDFGSCGSASSSSRARRQKLAPMQMMPGSRPLSVPRLSLPSKENSTGSPTPIGALGALGDAPSPLRAYAAMREHTTAQTDLQRQHREGRARSGSLSRTSPGRTKRRTGSREKDLASSQGTSGATRERIMKGCTSAPTLTLGLGPDELDLEGTGALNFDTCIQPVPAAPRSSNKCKSDAVLSRADAMLAVNRAASAPYLSKNRPCRNGMLPGDTETHRTSRSAGMNKAESLAFDPSMAWAPLQATTSPDILT